MHSLLSYAWACKEAYVLWFIDVCALDIVEDIMSFIFFPANSSDVYILHQSRKIMIKDQSMLSPLEKLDKDNSAAKSFGITNLDDSSLYVCSDEDIVLMIQAAECFVNIDDKPALSHSNFFYRQAIDICDKRHARPLEQRQEKFPSLALYFYTKTNQTKVLLHSIWSLPMITTRSFAYDARNEQKKCEAKTEMQEKGLCWRWSEISARKERFIQRRLPIWECLVGHFAKEEPMEWKWEKLRRNGVCFQCQRTGSRLSLEADGMNG